LCYEQERQYGRPKIKRNNPLYFAARCACLQTGTIYYFDLSKKTLNKMRIDGSGATEIDGYYAKEVEGIAVDWIGR